MCVFCDLKDNKKAILYENTYFYVIFDKFPVSKGHTLIISKRCASDFFELTPIEKPFLDEAIMTMKSYLDEHFHPDGYNIGINNKEAAGQTIFHFHLHLIPRYTGDTKAPRGGVRGVIKDKQHY
jgi:diadenosine tetraphosphate (Ap4A) HIT family hydrolase